MRMSNYRIGAYEALEWAWHMMRSYKDQPSGVDEARRAIQEMLATIGKGDDVNFTDRIPPIGIPQHHRFTLAPITKR